MDDTRHRINRLRYTILVLVVTVLFVAITGFGWVIRYGQRQTIQTQLAVTCTSARANVQQLTALNEIADRLGIPHDFVVPKVPPECADS